MSNDIRTWSGSTNEVFSTGSSSSTRSSYPILATTPLSEVVERGGAIYMLDPMQVLASLAFWTVLSDLAATIRTHRSETRGGGKGVAHPLKSGGGQSTKKKKK